MTQKEKDLLLRDLCSRLPYGVKCENVNHVYGKNIFKVTDIRDNGYVCGVINGQHAWAVFDSAELKPYLFPMESMTDEQYKEYCELEQSGNMEHLSIPLFDWCNKNHLDYRGLIPMGLAKDATNLNIYK